MTSTDARPVSHRTGALRRTRVVTAVVMATGLSIGALSVVVPASSCAQLAVNRIQLVLRPGSASQDRAVFTVTNRGEVSTQATVTFADWDRNDVGQNQFYPSGTRSGTCGRALTASPVTMRLEPGSSEDVVVTFRGTSELQRECWSVVFVENLLSPASSSGHSTTYLIRTGVKVYVLPADAHRGGQIVDLSILPPVRAGNVGAFALAFQNTGTRHETVTGAIQLRRGDNSIARRITLPTLYLLPGAVRKLTVPAPRVENGRYVALAVLDYGGADLAAGEVSYEVR